MFKALVTICVIGLPNNCQILEDQTGPYETEFACKQRALEISRQVHNITHYGNQLNIDVRNYLQGDLNGKYDIRCLE